MTSQQIDWSVDGDTLSFIPADTVGDTDTDTSTVAYLKEQTPVDRSRSVFNWTSEVYYTPDPSISGNVTVTCGTGGVMHCMVTVLVIGKLPIRA